MGTAHGAAWTVFSASCEGGGAVFAAETVHPWAKTPFVPRKCESTPVNGYSPPCERLQLFKEKT